MRVRLPNGIVEQGGDFYNYVTIDELRGKQQNYLVDKDLVVGNVGHVPKIIQDVVKTLETEEGMQWTGDMKTLAWKLTASDLETIFIKIRENTFGPRFYHEATCEHCSHKNTNLNLELDSLALDPIALADLMDAKKRTVILPKSKVEVELKPLYLKDIFDIIKATQNNTNSLITSLASVSVKRLGDKTSIKPEDLDNMAAMDVSFLSQVIENLDKSGLVMEGSIDTYSEFDCESCSKACRVKLNVFDPSFFSHSKVTLT